MSVFGVSTIGARWVGGWEVGGAVPCVDCAKAAIVSSARIAESSRSMLLLCLLGQQLLDEISGYVDGAPVANRQRREAAGVLHIELGAVVGQELNHFVNPGRRCTNMTYGGMHSGLPRLISGIDVTTQFERDLDRLHVGA